MLKFLRNLAYIAFTTACAVIGLKYLLEVYTYRTRKFPNTTATEPRLFK